MGLILEKDDDGVKEIISKYGFFKVIGEVWWKYLGNGIWTLDWNNEHIKE